jgi:hypothetical protein
LSYAWRVQLDDIPSVSGDLCRSGGVARYTRRLGAWLSLVERLVRDQEAGGSNPLAPTNPTLSLARRNWPSVRFGRCAKSPVGPGSPFHSQAINMGLKSASA